MGRKKAGKGGRSHKTVSNRSFAPSLSRGVFHLRWPRRLRVLSLPAQIALVASCGIYVSSPLLDARFVGTGDAAYYMYLLADFLTQFRHGIVPAYIGQSPFEFNGAPVLIIPYYFYLAVFIDFITLHHFSPVILQHLTVLVSFLAAGLFMYAALRSLRPSLGWESSAISCLYLMCPGVVAMISVFDSYYSILTIPWVVLLEDVRILVGTALRFLSLRDLTDRLRRPSLSLENGD